MKWFKIYLNASWNFRISYIIISFAISLPATETAAESRKTRHNTMAQVNAHIKFL